MARYITDLTELSSSTFASGDFIEVWHAAGGSNRSKKLRLDRFAMLSENNVFVGHLTVGIQVLVPGFDGGSGAGPALRLSRNNNGSTPSPGFIQTQDSGGGNRTIYATTDGLLRIQSVFSVTSANQASGTIVGTQTSSLDSKDVLGTPELGDLWERISLGAAAVRRFVFKPPYDWDKGERVGSRPFNGEEFSGVIVDYAPHYGMDRDADHPAGKSLNEINILGDLLLAVDWLIKQVTTDN